MNRQTFEFVKDCPFENLLKVHFDGRHFVGVRPTAEYLSSLNKRKKEVYKKKDIYKEYFDEIYSISIESGLTHSRLKMKLSEKILEKFPNLKNKNEFLTNEIKRKIHNFHCRKKRFKRKALNNPFNYFCTFTYDSSLMNENEFRQKLMKSLQNFHTRRGWKYMGVWERGEDTLRLHFHALVYIPDGESVGEIIEKKDYSTEHHKIQVSNQNTFFLKKFGRNDFDEINTNDLRYGGVDNYITKYLFKSSEYVVYSRGLASEFDVIVDNDEVCCLTSNGLITKFVLFDDFVIESNKVENYSDIALIPPIKQPRIEQISMSV